MIADSVAWLLDPWNDVLLGWSGSFIIALAYALRGRDKARDTLNSVLASQLNGQLLFAARWRLTRAYHNVWIAGLGLTSGMLTVIQMALDITPLLRPLIVFALVLLAFVFVRGLVIDDRRLDTLTNMLTPAPGAPTRRRSDQ